MSEQVKFVEQRKHRRSEVSLGGVVRTGLGEKQAVKLTDLSQSGFSVVDIRPMKALSSCSVKIEGLEVLDATIRWSTHSGTGFEFVRPLHPAVVDHLAGKHPRTED